jgi:hypothetical protein
MYPEARSVGLWLRHGWYIAIAYVIGFFAMLVLLGWHPDADHRQRASHTHGPSVAIGRESLKKDPPADGITELNAMTGYGPERTCTHWGRGPDEAKCRPSEMVLFSSLVSLTSTLLTEA